MNRLIAVGIAASLVLGVGVASTQPLRGAPRDEPYDRSVDVHEDRVDVIAFGSCHKVANAHDVWEPILELDPDVFVFLGDNVYADTEDMDELRRYYDRLGALEPVQKLFDSAHVLGTWDDHDYGRNDAGKEFPKKAESQQIMLDFFREPRNSERRRTPGVYDAEVFGPEGQRLQIILLDTRYFRDELQTVPSGERGERSTNGVRGWYVPDPDPSKTMLGRDQWAWLEARLREPADLRIIASSIQVVAEDHGFEKWANLPTERGRLFDTIRRSGADSVVFISGDRHRSELSKLDVARAAPGSAVDVGFDVYDLTSSALNNSSGRWVNEINRHRLGSQYLANNFGVIEIDWEADEPTVEFRIHAEDGRTVIRERVPMSELRR